MKVAVVGGRDFADTKLLADTLDQVRSFDCLVSGKARGADSLAESYADLWNIPKIIHVPEWKKYGKGAAFIRNQLIIDDADIVVAFWDGKSKGTKDSIDRADKKGVPVIIVRYEPK